MQTLEQRVKWARREDRDKDPVDFLRENYPENITRSRLAQEDSALYRIISRHNRLDEAIPHYNKRSSEAWRETRLRVTPWGLNPRAYFKRHYSHLGRKELRKQVLGLYERARAEGWLEEELPQHKQNFEPDALTYFLKNYPGFTRTKLQKENPTLHKSLKEEGKLGHVPYADMSKVRRQASRFGLDALEYYHENHPGIVKEDLGRIDRGLRDRLYRDNLLQYVPSRNDLKTRNQVLIGMQ